MTDFLTVDAEVPGQKFVCLSFLSPENVLKNKEMYFVEHFLEKLNSDLKLGYNDIVSKYADFKYANEMELSEKFDSENKFQTSVRGVKIKGTYSTLEEAHKRAGEFQKKDKSFHVFVGAVGHWLPWDPTHKYLDSVEDQEYQEPQLNELMGSYKKNEINKDIFFQERKEEAMKDALLDNEKRDPWLEKREQASLDDATGEPVVENDIVIEDVEEEVVDKLVTKEM
jgi:hypothetical protein